MDEKASKNNKAVAAFVLGIVALIVPRFGPGVVLTLILSITGLILAMQARKVASGESNALATAGMICSIIALALSVIAVIGGLFWMFGMGHRGFMGGNDFMGCMGRF